MSGKESQFTSRVRPGDPSWPSKEHWDRLNHEVNGRLIKVESPLAVCHAQPDGEACTMLLKQLRNPYYIADQPALTQTSGWVDAWTSVPSVYAVAATKTQDIVAAVNFARENNLRLVIKGGGHSYQGTSSAADSLLIWTHDMNNIVLHDDFVAHGCVGKHPPQPAVTVEAGAIWKQVYDVVTTYAGRYVQGGGCTTVGVAGLIQSGGFGSFSKHYGLAAAGLLEAEIITADGEIRIANACTNPDLFWALKGGGGGSFGVVTKLTLMTRALPEFFGGVFGTIKARSDASFRNLIARLINFYHDHLFNQHWGEQIIFEPGNTTQIAMVFQGLNRQQAEAVWQPFLEAIASSPQDFTVDVPIQIMDIPARHFWDANFLKKHYSSMIIADDRPDAPENNIFWIGDSGQVGQFVYGYRSAWLSAGLLGEERQLALSEALFASSRHWAISLHFNKGLAGASADVLAAGTDTAMNPAVLDAFALAIIAGNSPPAFPGMSGHEPDLTTARKDVSRIKQAMEELMKVAPQSASYLAEGDFFERDWAQSFWGTNYSRLVSVKNKFDPNGLFFVHHGVGSNEWSTDGFNRLLTAG